MERSAWNLSRRGISCGAVVISRVWMPSRNRSQNRSTFSRFRSHARDAEPKSEPQHFTRDQNQGHHDMLGRPGAPAAAGYISGLLRRSRNRNYKKFLINDCRKIQNIF